MSDTLASGIDGTSPTVLQHELCAVSGVGAYQFACISAASLVPPIGICREVEFDFRSRAVRRHRTDIANFLDAQRAAFAKSRLKDLAVGEVPSMDALVEIGTEL